MVPLSCAATMAGSLSPNTRLVAWRLPPRSSSSSRSAAMPSSPEPAMPVPMAASSTRRVVSSAWSLTSAA
jgi:hypothetical protein